MDKLLDRAVTHMAKEEYREALSLLDALMRKDPANVFYRHNRAVCLFHVSAFKDALREYKVLAKASPSHAEYQFQIGNIYDHLDSLDMATRYYTAAIGLKDDDATIFFKRGTISLKQQKWVSAVLDFNRALALDSTHDNSMHNRGIALYKIGKRKEACNDWCRATKAGNPTSTNHFDSYCENYKKECDKNENH
jgi:lipoprotein NlpI